MKWLTFVLLAILAGLQYKLWLGDGGVWSAARTETSIGQQRVENARLSDRNRALEAEVIDLKKGHEAAEERARSELGMVRKGEVFYRVVEN
ncbi:MAG: cell division protein FtsB [Gammaproteobacteria bacterium]|nr:cell division protein FtsB [Gammaproteobacteria bacterium]